MCKKISFLFGAGAELPYGMPSGSDFAFDIFKNLFSSNDSRKKIKNNLETLSSYIESHQDKDYSDWLPKNFAKKTVYKFSKNVLEEIIKSTIEQNKFTILNDLSNFDTIFEENIKRINNKKINIKSVLINFFEKQQGLHQGKQLSVNKNLAFNVNKTIFNSTWFLQILDFWDRFHFVEKQDSNNKLSSDLSLDIYTLFTALAQFQISCLGDDYAKQFNDDFFENCNGYDFLLGAFGSILKVDYSNAGLDGFKLLLEKQPKELIEEELDDKNISTEKIGLLLFNILLLSFKSIIVKSFDYRNLIDSNWSYLYSPKANWSKFCQILTLLESVYSYITNYKLPKNEEIPQLIKYYDELKGMVSKFSNYEFCISTTNYTELLDNTFPSGTPKSDKNKINEIIHLNGSVMDYYDPYLNESYSESNQCNNGHLLVPLLYTQSGTKPMTSINILDRYFTFKDNLINSSELVVVGYGFNECDDNINAIIRAFLLNKNASSIPILHYVYKPDKSVLNKDRDETKEILRKLKIRDLDYNFKIVLHNIDDSNFKFSKILN